MSVAAPGAWSGPVNAVPALLASAEDPEPAWENWGSWLSVDSTVTAERLSKASGVTVTIGLFAS